MHQPQRATETADAELRGVQRQLLGDRSGALPCDAAADEKHSCVK